MYMKHKYFYTYKVLCTAVGWEDYYYLGKHVTSNLDDGYKGSGKKLKEYYTLYPNDYTFTILAFYSNKTELNTAEHNLIGNLYKTDPYCLNCTAGGNGSWALAHENRKGRSRTEEEKRKISESTKKTLNTLEVKQKMSKSQKGKHRSEEHKRKISEALKGKPSGMKGKHQSEEAKRKISEETRGKNNPMYGEHLSEEVKRKLSEAMKGKHRVYREDGTYYYE